MHDGSIPKIRELALKLLTCCLIDCHRLQPSCTINATKFCLLMKSSMFSLVESFWDNVQILDFCSFECVSQKHCDA